MDELAQAFEKINKEIVDLTALVQSHRAQGDISTLDVDRLVKAVKDAADAQVTARLEEAEGRRPVYKGELVGPPGWRVPSRGIVQSGKFAGQQIDDMIFVANFLNRSAALGGGKGGGGGGGGERWRVRKLTNFFLSQFS